MADIHIVRVAHRDLEDVIPLFDEYREFYEAGSDHAAARAFLTERTERDESVIFLAYASPHEPVGFTQLYPSFSSVSLKRLWILNDLFVRSECSDVAASAERFSNGRESMRSRHKPKA